MEPNKRPSSGENSEKKRAASSSSSAASSSSSAAAPTLVLTSLPRTLSDLPSYSSVNPHPDHVTLPLTFDDFMPCLFDGLTQGVGYKTLSYPEDHIVFEPSPAGISYHITKTNIHDSDGVVYTTTADVFCIITRVVHRMTGGMDIISPPADITNSSIGWLYVSVAYGDLVWKFLHLRRLCPCRESNVPCGDSLSQKVINIGSDLGGDFTFYSDPHSCLIYTLCNGKANPINVIKLRRIMEFFA